MENNPLMDVISYQSQEIDRLEKTIRGLYIWNALGWLFALMALLTIIF